MNIDDIKEVLTLIEKEAISMDDEEAHSIEDYLLHSFVQHISKGTFEGDIKEGAKEVLLCSDIEFSRWCG